MFNIFLLSMMMSGQAAPIMLAENDPANMPAPEASAPAETAGDMSEQPPPTPTLSDAERAAADEYAGKAIAAHPENYRSH
ncbi:hypothetical protein [Aquitalea magnusonii]|uniref:Uncharacterized protein n=1 Tax=Aquitalea magnusonii TaxID=332411 RepID=A0A318JFF4_9NEIS|nr:hypothetical protein [Aquitalea magnusonii]PXX45929.1 hypothetical protein DFR38_11027 [Aquitalea magnusonii]